MSSGNITDSGNNGNGNSSSADKIDWKRVASPDLIEQKDSDANNMTVQQYYCKTYNIHIK
ncbi:hypothetical protein SCLCIDRAFT_32842 [Scleroderma citrinum Foug A]|uniref:Uncharacterized protein n=1 Tax=Scleroderma citrinum Foug A TaxID=1036808 RepID=A0A0C3D718_9AGAM|nr:hypothetical protein SCLCIDRAFT_32842 [Scleroderma citrinum Foug A]